MDRERLLLLRDKIFVGDENRALCNMALDALRYRKALELVAMRRHEVVLSEPVNWYEVADCMASIARKALDGGGE